MVAEREVVAARWVVCGQDLPFSLVQGRLFAPLDTLWEERMTDARDVLEHLPRD